MVHNPYRIDYHERYQKIIEEYNSGKEYKAIKEIFDQLLGLYNSLDEESSVRNVKALQKMNWQCLICWVEIRR